MDEEGITYFDVYLTERPHRLPGDRHPFSYEVPDPPGTITYDPNPRVTWRADVGDPDAIVVSADLDLRPRFRGDDGVEIALAHTGTVTATGPASGSPAHDVHLEFPGLIGDETPLLIDLTIEPEAPYRADGDVVVDGQTLATIGGTGEALSFEWR